MARRCPPGETSHGAIRSVLKQTHECGMIQAGSSFRSTVGRTRVRMRVPRSFKQVRHGSTIAIVRDDLLPRLDALVLEGNTESLDPTGLAGRGSIGAVPRLLVDGSRVLVRQAKRGGLVGHLIPDVFCGRCRPFRELQVAERARARGVPTPGVVAATRTTLFGPLYRGAVYTKEIAGTSDLHSYFASLAERPDAASLRRKRDTLREAGRVVRGAHDAGLYHGDLQLRNVLVRHDATPAVFLVDLDKAGWREPLPRVSRMMNLLRLSRSAAKAARSGLCITRTDMVRFLEGYTRVEGAGALRTYWRVPLLKWLYKVKWTLSDALYRATGGSAQKSTR